MPVYEFYDNVPAEQEALDRKAAQRQGKHPCGWSFGDCGGVCDGCGNNPEESEVQE
jgi:hypothetical protein